MTEELKTRFLSKALVFAAVVLMLPLSACKADESAIIALEAETEEPQSLPFLVVDIDGDGIDFIPLEDSNVYFDVDGDGMAERTTWIGPDDGIFFFFTRKMDNQLQDIPERLVRFTTGGIELLQSFDGNKDQEYNRSDIITGLGIVEHWPGTAIIWVDLNSDGYIQKGEQKHFNKLCEFKGFHLQDVSKKTSSSIDASFESYIECEDRNLTYYEIRLPFDSSNKKQISSRGKVIRTIAPN